MKDAQDKFFKSVSIRLDTLYPERFAHFRPTQKSSHAINAVLHGAPSPAGIIVAAYGSGKSLSAGTGLMAVENSPNQKPLLKKIAAELKGIDPKLSEAISSRIRSRKHGLVVALEGHQADLQAELCEQAKKQLRYFRGKTGDLLQTLTDIGKKAGERGYDRVAIVWDEFGRHLEALAVSGQAEALSTVQQIAEWAVRQKQPSATLNLLLHQNFSNYAGSLSQASLNSWRKIEGRFNIIRFVEDSSEIFELVASVIRSRRSIKTPPPLDEFKTLAKQAVGFAMFASFKDKNRLARMLRDAHPLHPATLYMLPRLASRLAQNERTIFSYIEDANLGETQSLGDLYRYFAPAMEADRGLGGTYRRWLETQSALSKTLNKSEGDIISAAALLSLGISGERTKVTKKMLMFSVGGSRASKAEKLNGPIEDLIGRKLLLYRERNDDISVWHGTDIDLRSYLQEQKLQIEGGFDPIAVLDKEFPATYWYPIIHNIHNSIRRYYQGKFVAGDDLLKQGTKHPVLHLGPGEDGRIVYCLPSSVSQIKRLIQFAEKVVAKHSGIVISISGKVLPIRDVLVEINGLRNLLTNRELLGRDPFVLPELLHMLDAAQESLWRMLSKVISPTSHDAQWYAERKRIEVHNGGQLRKRLSALADKRFPSTPHIQNEMIVRHKVSKPMVNARKKLVLAILEKSGSPDLGFNPSATTPDTALYRTVLLNTGLYRDRKQSWGWATPEQVKDPGLAAVWAALKKFFQNEGNGKQPEILLNALANPPHGIRRGVLPILFAAGMQAFSRAIVIRYKGEYLSDILASEIEAICAAPELYIVDSFGTDQALLDYLGDLTELFSGSHPRPDSDHVRAFYDAVEDWKQHLPAPALTAKKVSGAAKKLQRAIKIVNDPAMLALKEFSQLTGSKKPNSKTVEIVSELSKEIERIVDRYTSQAIESIRSTIAIVPDESSDVLSKAKEWADCVNGADLEALNPAARALLGRAREAGNGRYTEASFARALSALLVGKGIDGWEDASVKVFSTRLREAVSEIEQAALASHTPSTGTAYLLKRRIIELVGKYNELQGTTEVAALLSSLGSMPRTKSRAKKKIDRMAKG